MRMPPADHPASSVREDHPEHSICEIFRGDRIVGLGFAVGHAHVATCAHVVNSALGRADKRDPAWPGNVEMIWLRFPIGAADGGDERQKASVIGWLPASAGTFDSDDVAVLRLDEPAPAHVRVLRPARYRPSMPVQMWGLPLVRNGRRHPRAELNLLRSSEFVGDQTALSQSLNSGVAPVAVGRVGEIWRQLGCGGRVSMMLPSTVSRSMIAAPDYGASGRSRDRRTRGRPSVLDCLPMTACFAKLPLWTGLPAPRPSGVPESATMTGCALPAF